MTKVAPYTGVRAMGLGPSAESLAGWSTMLGTSVVIKRYEPVGSIDEDLERLLVDLDRWFSLQHDGLIIPIEAGTNDDGGVFVARPFIAGQPAASWIRSTPRPDRSEILSVLAGVARTLAGLHRSGVSHGAVTASNIIVVHEAERACGLLTDPRPSLSFAIGSAGPSASPGSDTEDLATVALELLIGHPLPAGVDDALTAVRSGDDGARPTMADLDRAFSAGAMLVTPHQTPARSSPEPSVTPRDQATLPPAGSLADDLEALRHSAPSVDRSVPRTTIAIGLAAVAAIAALVGGIWWTLQALSNPSTTTAVRVTDEVQLAVSRVEFAETPRGGIEVTITATIASAEPEVLSCPGRDCTIELLLGRRADTASTTATARSIRFLAIDARRLGVTTSPRRGTVDALAPTADRTDESDPLRSPSGTTRLVFTVANGTEILGLSALGDDSTILGFSKATDWPADRD